MHGKARGSKLHVHMVCKHGAFSGIFYLAMNTNGTLGGFFLLSSFLQFSPVFTSVYIYLSIIVWLCLKTPRFVQYLHIGET